MKYIKTFESFSANQEVNEEILGGLAKAINIIGSKNLDLNMSDDKVQKIAKEVGYTYENGKITKGLPARMTLATTLRKQLTEGGIPNELVDKAVVLYLNYSKLPVSFDQDAEGGLNILKYDATKKILNCRSASTSGGGRGVGGGKI